MLRCLQKNMLKKEKTYCIIQRRTTNGSDIGKKRRNIMEQKKLDYARERIERIFQSIVDIIYAHRELRVSTEIIQKEWANKIDGKMKIEL